MASSGAGARRLDDGPVYRSTVLALILAIFGSSVLPVSYAISKTGIFPGFCISVGVALCNAYTCRLLLNVALATGTNTFEEMAEAVGGRVFKVVAQAANITLLLGNLTGDLCLLADLGSKSLTVTLGRRAPQLLTREHGRGIMLCLTLGVIAPLSLSKGMRGLEYVSSGGLVILAVLFAVLTSDAIASGFAGVGSHRVPLFGLPQDKGSVSEAFALLGFSFYLHPLMMPMLSELPAGEPGVRIMQRGVDVVVVGVALVVYTALGAMGAAAFGADTRGDIMLNQLLTSPFAAAALSISVLVYLSSCIPPLILSLRSYIGFALAGPRAAFDWTRHVSLTAGIIAVPFALAWHNPAMAEVALALTGATGVCVVCYVIPVVAHLRLLHNPVPVPPGAEEEAGLLDQPSIARAAGATTGIYDKQPLSRGQWLLHVVRPVVVLLLGVGLSGLAIVHAAHRSAPAALA